MALSAYLPSTQFVVIVGSIALSIGLVLAAQYVTNPPSSTPSSLTSGTPEGGVPTGDWLANLRAIEGENVGVKSTTTAATFGTLLQSVQSSNLTDTVARTLFINLSEAKSQGLGSDIPTQEKLIANAAAQIRQNRTIAYVSEDITVSSNTNVAFKSYGNQVITTINLHPRANFVDTVYAVGLAIENNNKKDLAELTGIQAEYYALAKDLTALKVPPTLVPLHLQAVNNFTNMGDSLSDIQTLFSDSLRGLAGFEFYQGLNDETERVFINIAQELSRNGILFNKDEAGSAWSSFLSP